MHDPFLRRTLQYSPGTTLFFPSTILGKKTCIYWHSGTSSDILQCLVGHVAVGSFRFPKKVEGSKRKIRLSARWIWHILPNGREKSRERSGGEKSNKHRAPTAKKTDGKAEQGEPHRIHTAFSSLPPSISLSPEPDPIHAALSSDGSSPFQTAARGHRHQVPCGLNASLVLR